LLGAFLIGLREGLEAAVIVGIVLAYLKQIQQTGKFGHVWIGTQGPCW